MNEPAPDPTALLPLDHLVFAVPHIRRSVEEFADATGVRPVFGGRHDGRGTVNYLVRLDTPSGDPAYLELLGLDDDQPDVPADRTMFRIGMFGAEMRPHLRTWAIHPRDIDALAERARAAGVDVGAVEPWSRRTPDGTLLQWRVAILPDVPESGLQPFLIDWGSSPHPSRTPGLGALPLRQVRLEHPHPDRLEGRLRALGLDGRVEVRFAVVPSIVATLGSAHGDWELR